jgi:predicted DNA-binding transcriptional regulator AlpA
MSARRSSTNHDESTPSGANLRTEVQAAAFLGVSPRVLQKWRVTGRGPQFLRLSSRCIRYSQSDLLCWIESRAFSATAEYARTRAQRRPAKLT